MPRPLMIQRCLVSALFAMQCIVFAPRSDAASCSTQAQMAAVQRDALANAARTLARQIQAGDVQGVQTNTLPAVAADFSGIAASIQTQKPLLDKASLTVDNLYLLDAASDPAGSPRTDFYCGQPVVSLNFTNLPPGVYALAIVHATGVQQPQQISLILAKGAQERWMLAGLFSKPMTELGHDGLWYWTSARKYAQGNMKWDAWLYYRVASFLLNPIDLLSSANLEKLQQERDKVRPDGFTGSSPISLKAQNATYSLTAIDTTTTFGALDLDVHYSPDAAQTAALRDPPSARKQVLDVMSALLQQHPGLQQAFHGMWVHADQGSGSLFALELPMNGISGSGGAGSH
jgi:hypothetical protein